MSLGERASDRPVVVIEPKPLFRVIGENIIFQRTLSSLQKLERKKPQSPIFSYVALDGHGGYQYKDTIFTSPYAEEVGKGTDACKVVNGEVLLQSIRHELKRAFMGKRRRSKFT